MDRHCLKAYQCVEAMRDARCDFFVSVVDFAHKYKTEQGNELSREERSQLRLESVEQMAEFLFLMQTFDLNHDPEKLRLYLDGHNDRINSKLNRLKEQSHNYTDAGVPASRLMKGVLEPCQIQAMVDEADDMGLRYDQSSLGALLIEVMSLASSRNLIILLSDCGFLKRKGSGAKNIRSTGGLEKLYQKKVNHIVEHVSGTKLEAAA